MRKITIAFAVAIFLSIFLQASNRALAADAPRAGQKTAAVKWTIKFQPMLGMVDLYLNDAKSNRAITNAKLKAVITMPDGQKVEKEMMYMSMKKPKDKAKKSKTKDSSYMFSLDMSAPGTYAVEISGKAGKRDIEINAKYVVK